MARSNATTAVTPKPKTHEGGPAQRLTAIKELRRSVLACLLFEDSFYESGTDAATRIEALVEKCDPEAVATLAIKARSEFNLRHVGLLLCAKLAHMGKLRHETLTACIQRADEMAEFIAIYNRETRQPLSWQVKVGLRNAFAKFDAFQLARYQGHDRQVKLRDVMRMVHPAPTEGMAEVYAGIVKGTQPAPDSWEAALARGGDKAGTFTRLLTEGRLGYMALLRNLRNMREAKVDKALIEKELLRGAGRSRVLPFRFMAAAMTNPEWESMIERAMLDALKTAPRLPGRTILMVDVSESMNHPISAKSDLNRIKAATALAILCREVCEDVAIVSFSNNVVKIPDRHGFALAEAIERSQPHSGTPLGEAIETVRMNVESGDRLIVFTDEQSRDKVGLPIGNGYMVNVAGYAPSVAYGPWVSITGFSEAVLEFIRLSETLDSSVGPA